MSTKNTGQIVALAIVLLFCAHGAAQDSRTGPLTTAIRENDDAKTREAFTKLEEIRQTVITAKPGDTLWNTGRQAFPHLQVLADRWDDPRSEDILKQLTNSGPRKIEGELEMQTLAYAAEKYLILLQDNRDYDGLLKGIKKPEERVKTIRAYFDTHPDLLETKCVRTPNRPIVRMLLNEAEKIHGANMLDLLVRSQLYGTDHFKQYKEELCAYAKQLGREKAVSTPHLLQYITSTGNTNSIPLLEQWFREDANGEIASALAQLPGAKERLLSWLSDERPGVACMAANWLILAAPDAQSINAIKLLIDRKREVAGSQKEINVLENVVRSIEQMMTGK